MSPGKPLAISENHRIHQKPRVWDLSLIKGKGHTREPTYASRDEKREEIATQPPLLLLQASAGF